MAKRGPKPGKRVWKLAASWEDFAPPDLDAEAAGEFRRLAAQLTRLGVIGKTDPRIVVAAARTHSLIERAQAELAGAGLTATAANGTLMPHPMIAVVNTLTMRLKSLWSELGLTPASAKLTAPKDDRDANPWKDILGVVG